VDNVIIRFHNYKNTKEQRKNIERRIVFLIKQIPCDSRISLDFSYKNKIFSGKIKIDTIGKSFISSDQSILLESLIKSLNKKSLKQIMKWKKSRTLEEITGIISINSDHDSVSFPYEDVS